MSSPVRAAHSGRDITFAPAESDTALQAVSPGDRDQLVAQPTRLAQSAITPPLALPPPEKRPGTFLSAPQAPQEALPTFDWTAAMQPPRVEVGQLVPFPPRSNDPVEQERRLAAWREAEAVAQRQPAVGRPYHQRPEAQRLMREIAGSDQAEYERLMALLERVALPRATANIAPPSARPTDERTSFERSVRGYLDSGIQRGTAYALEFGAQAEEAARRRGIDVAAIYGTLRGETNMGGFSGGHNAFQQIVRGAFDGGRTEFFRGELRALVRVGRERGWDLATLGGSSAGALGWCQFMPSNLVLLAGDLDPWHPVQAAELAARFYENVGRDRPSERYTQGQPIGVELRGSSAAIRRLRHDTEMTVGQLRKAGFTIPASFPASTRGRVLRFGSDTSPEAFFAGPNAVTIRRYNWGERHYGDRAGLLAGRIMDAAERERAKR